MTGTPDYPFQQEPVPGDGSSVEIAPGLLWLRMPLRGSLAFINVWAVAEQEGWAIIDTGVHSAATVEAWRSALQGCLDSRPIIRIVVTHMHPDHCGMVGWMTEQFEAPLWMTRLEYLTCRVLVADTGRPVPQEAVRFYRAAGWSEEAIEWYRARFGSFGKSIASLPAAFHRLSAEDELRLGDYTWRVVIGRGHSPEHACLYCAERGLLISGDQVLPRISSNVSVFPTEPDADPLADWLSSLTQLKARVPDDVLVLPAHNSPFVGLHARIDALIAGHARGLEKLEELLIEPRRAVDVFAALFTRSVSGDLLVMATGEALAHLNYLRVRGRVRRWSDAQGVWWWQRQVG